MSPQAVWKVSPRSRINQVLAHTTERLFTDDQILAQAINNSPCQVMGLPCAYTLQHGAGMVGEDRHQPCPKLSTPFQLEPPLRATGPALT